MKLRYKILMGIWGLALLIGAGYEIYSQVSAEPRQIAKEVIAGLMIVSIATAIVLGIKGILKARNRLFGER